jgi:tRNA pseudouridine38-40 synthase
MKNIKIVIEYDGTGYHGWQKQINAITVQDKIEEALTRLTKQKTVITGASRTDRGVHALGQVANFFTESAIPPEKYPYALNSILPEDITVKRSELVDADFHSRFSAKGKKYIYSIYNATFPSALLRNRAYHVYYPLDIKKMQAAARHIVGTHDFSAFMASGSDVVSTVRTITSISFEKKGNNINMEIQGDGFLYNMVRIIAGTLVEVGWGAREPDSLPQIITDKDRRKAGKTAPAQGLYLAEVFY